MVADVPRILPGRVSLLRHHQITVTIWIRGRCLTKKLRAGLTPVVTGVIVPTAIDCADIGRLGKGRDLYEQNGQNSNSRGAQHESLPEASE